jgi:sulfonate transport system substrate-binding protein
MNATLTRRRVLASLLVAATLALGGAEAAFAQGKAATPPVLRIAFQKGSIGLALLKQRGTLEKRLPQYAITWIEFPAGPQLLEALALGSADIGAVGDTPPIFAQAAGKDLVYVGVEPPRPDSSAILVGKDSPVRALADLKGRKIAFQKGSSAHYLTVRALEKAGLAYKDIEPVYLPPADARAAFERGSVDAWAIWDPYYAAAELLAPTRTLATGRDLTSNNSFYLASRAFAERSGEVIGTLFDELNKTDAFLHDQRKDAIALYAAFAGLEPEVVATVFARRKRANITALTPAIIDDQQRVADTFERLGLIPKPIRVAEIVWLPGRVALSKSQ